MSNIFCNFARKIVNTNTNHMKKSLFFAFALVASVLAFVSCNNDNDPDEITDLQSLVGTKWRVDSIVVDGQQQPNQMDDVYKLVSENSFIHLDKDQDLISIFLKDHKLTVGKKFRGQEMTFDVVKYTEEYVHLSTTTEVEAGKKATMKMTLGRIPDSNGPDVTLNKENVVGTWKADYYWEHGTYSGSGQEWDRLMVSYNFHGLDMWTLKEDGTVIFENLFDKANSGGSYTPQTGYWKILGNDLYIRLGDANFDTPDICDIEKLTTNILYFKTVLNDTRTYHYYHKVR